MNSSIGTIHALYLLVSLSLFFLSGCIHRRQIDKKELHYSVSSVSTNIVTEHVPQAIHTAPPITIWVHGTLLFRKPGYYHIFHGKSYLMPAKDLNRGHFFYQLAHAIAQHDPEHFPLETFYIFGWSGQLLATERKAAAQKLYLSLIDLIERYQTQYNTYPAIRIIAHSHGGNVVLNMAKIKNITTLPHINSLILLACPVQEKTMYLINKPMFKRVYSLYSSFDFVQVLAPQLFRPQTVDSTTMKRKRHYRFPPFSSRLFPPQPNLTQAKVKINGYPISHTSFSMADFTQMLPTILQKLDAWHEEATAKNTLHKYKLLCIYKNYSKKQNSIA